ncbi:hypothetical protein [Dactylosporangium sp. NPDC049140]|uniref:hypothetical protein n=1 Tax=Dactylosporangium sp. NPDC049140 TaxID=3155647 RepID=UPI00340E7B2D
MALLAVVLATLALLAVPAWQYLHRGDRATGAAEGAHTTPAPLALPSGALRGAGAASGPASRSPGALRTDDKSPAVSVQPGAQAEASVVFGPYICNDQYTWDLGHPALAKPCHSLAPDQVRVIGHMESIPGAQADVSMSVLDAGSGERVDGPHDCNGLMFTDFAPDHTCGPFEVRLPRGHRYVVEEKWVYTNRALLPGGEVRGLEFDW